MSRAQQAADAAAAWIIRRENGNWTASDQAEFDAWITKSDGNRAAYWRLKHSWQEADRVRSLGIRPSNPVEGNRFGRYWKPAAIAASLAVIVGFGVIHFGMPNTAPQIATVRYDTPVGGRVTVPLVDGSKIDLNTKTIIRTAVSVQKREIWLDRGEAFFEVAHDPEHPFVVHAGAKIVTVLGTKFSIRRDSDRLTVSVLEGRVRIDDAANRTEEHASSATIAGGVIAISQGPSTLVTQRSAERVEKALAWRDGMLSFDQATLADVAAEFNRYNLRPIIVTDPKAAGIRIGGTFQASNIDAFVRLLRDAYGLRVVGEAGAIKIST